MAIRETIEALKTKEGTLTNNKVCNFAYDDTAFADDTTAGANGVINYNYNNHNNIPVKDNSVIKVNATVTSKGFRSQVSTLPRMFLNHIFGRVSYNLNKTVDVLNDTLQALYGAIGQANGLATLDNTGRLPYSQLPLSAIEYKGAWNASSNSPYLSAGNGTFGDEYIVSVQGTRNLGEGNVTYRVGDRVIYNGSIWQRIPSSSVRTVNSKAPDANGNVTVNAGDMITPDVYGYNRLDQGKNWSRTKQTFDNIAQIVEGNGIFVGASATFEGNSGNSGLWWSEDGANWTQSNITSGRCECKFALGIFVALVYNNSDYNITIYVSTDGKTWSSAGVNPISATTMGYLFYVNKRWIACIGTSLLVSTDAVTWSTITVPNTFTSMCYGNGVYVAGTRSHGLWYSTDLTTWTSVGSSNPYIYGVDYHDGMFVAVATYDGSAGFYIMNSTTGTSWHSPVPPVNSNKSPRAFTYVNGNWIVLIDKGIYFSTDGETWQTHTQILSSYSRCYLFDIDFYDGIYVIATEYGLFYTTSLGGNLTAVTYGDSTQYTTSVYTVLYARGLWLGTGKSAYAYYSAGSPTNNVKTILDWLIHAVDSRLN